MSKSPLVGFSKYTKIEVVFFLTYFFGFRILTDLEYNFWEEQYTGLSWKDIESVLAFGTAALPAFLLFYKGLHSCIQKRRVWTFVILVILFLVGYGFYQKAVYFLYARIDFFSEEFRRSVLRFYESQSIGYSFVYVFREMLVISALSYFVHSLRQSEQLNSLREDQLISELKYLKAQLQPHFFFNTLNNIYGLALEGSKDTAPMVGKLAEMMRYILYRAQNPMVPLRQEISFLKSYVDIERLRHTNRASIEIDMQGDVEGVLVAPLIFLPFVENAFKHGISNTVDRSFVSIVFISFGGELHFQVMNSKISSSVMTESKGGIGLYNVKQRLTLLYPKRHTLAIVDEADFFLINLTLS
ncbi:sensor histidine kinase [Parapedobacter sp. GCM10030251]|uniref:sensor histidine kinase n=1 Tax=Parapedobacter sp. GCM10030251 TaxID=3273419 RepID=UPI003623106A